MVDPGLGHQTEEGEESLAVVIIDGDLHYPIERGMLEIGMHHQLENVLEYLDLACTLPKERSKKCVIATGK